MQEDQPQEPTVDEQAQEPPPGEHDFEGEEDHGVPPEYDAEGYTTSDFHNVVQKQVLNATYETLVETKMHWALIEPFLHAAREVCVGDFRRTGSVRIHGVAADGEAWVEAEEAYVSLSIADQDDGHEWLAETWWLSDLVLAGADPARVREAARALERTVAKLDAWLATQSEGPDEAG
ncbi:MAG TPA: hypothetical protein VD887_03185 [Allosphingosinicella sp.]|nr:hypothetical protein [Allosphingosinicella sp.]